jgi:N-glycosylase/DNA lyase
MRKNGGHPGIQGFDAAAFEAGGKKREASMQITLTDDFDLDKIADSGQCFRWQPLPGGGYRICAFRRAVTARQEGHRLTLDCSEGAYQSIWRRYFDMETDYAAIRGRVDPGDAYLQAAARAGRGIRILRQDPWETLVSFIISQRKNIPAIRSGVEKLCAVAGDLIGEAAGGPLYAFPSPAQVLALDCRKAGSGRCSFQDAGAGSCSLGYRMPYVRAAARWMTAHDVAALDALDDASLERALMQIKGVGVKVAACAMLFGFHRMNAFPVDVWVKRALQDGYGEAGFDPARYAPYAGVMQQYLFYAGRQRRRSHSG